MSNLADSKNKKFENLRICILDRPRHKKIIDEAKSLNIDVKLITDGDVSGALLVTDKKYNIDLFLGTGGGPEGVLAASALDSYGCGFQGRFIFDSSGRSFELRDVYRIIDKLTENYAVIIMSTIKVPPPEKPNPYVVMANDTNLLQWMGIINACDYFVGCDSMGQHYAHALDKPATVVIGSTFPENITYPGNSQFTVIDAGKKKTVYAFQSYNGLGIRT